MNICIEDNCDGEALKKGYCSFHYPVLLGHPLKPTWVSMIIRCSNPRYRDYNGRGITVCDRWKNDDGLQNFINDMGPKPTRSHSVDRIDNNGNYEPDNCRWATQKQQVMNSRRNIGVYTRVYPVKNKEYPWRTILYIDGKKMFLNMYQTFEEAQAAQERVVAKYATIQS